MDLVPGLSAEVWISCCFVWAEMEVALSGREPALQIFSNARNGIQASYVVSSTAHHLARSEVGQVAWASSAAGQW